MSSAVPPPLTEGEVAEAERDLGIEFPPEYRDYLCRQGGDGSVARLEKTERGWCWVGNSWRRREPLTAPTRTQRKTTGAIVARDEGCGFATLLVLAGRLPAHCGGTVEPPAT